MSTPCDEVGSSAAERLEAPRSTPLDPDAAVASADHAGQAVGDAELGEQRLDPGMQRLARLDLARAVTLEQDHAQAARRAGDGGSGPGRAAADHDQVGIDRSTTHGPSPRRRRTVLPAT